MGINLPQQKGVKGKERKGPNISARPKEKGVKDTQGMEGKKLMERKGAKGKVVGHD